MDQAPETTGQYSYRPLRGDREIRLIKLTPVTKPAHHPMDTTANKKRSTTSSETLPEQLFSSKTSSETLFEQLISSNTSSETHFERLSSYKPFQREPQGFAYVSSMLRDLFGEKLVRDAHYNIQVPPKFLQDVLLSDPKTPLESIYRSLRMNYCPQHLRQHFGPCSDWDTASEASTFNLSIQHRTLDDSPLFTAVSYEWGSSKAKANVLINGCSLEVPANVVTMLSDLCDPQVSRYLWIDAISIDQRQLEERNHQVRLMGDIYTQANYVLVYLGRRCIHAKQYFEDISYNTYFSRRWIIQEFCLARSIILVSGNNERWAAEDLLESGTQSTRPHLRTIRTDLLTFDETNRRDMNQAKNPQTVALLNQRRRARQGGSVDQITLERLLTDHDMAKCADYHDVVYSLVALSSKPESMIIDYGLSRSQLLEATLRFSVEHESLSPQNTMSLATRLHIQMARAGGRGTGNLWKDIQRHPVPAPDHQPFSLCAMTRGIVSSQALSAAHERAVYELRQALKPMTQNPPMKVICDGTNTSTFEMLDRDTGSMFRTIGQVGPYEMFAFMCQSSFRYSSQPRKTTEVGLSTVAVRTNDEIWQFRGTRLALVVRKSEDKHFTIIGRARMLNQSELNAWKKKSDDVASNKDPPFEHRAFDDEERRNISATMMQLFSLLFWTL